MFFLSMVCMPCLVPCKGCVRLQCILKQGFKWDPLYPIQYAHLQKEGRPANGSIVNAGDIVGIQGNSGNLEKAMREGWTEYYHTHIVAKKRNGNGWNLDNDYTIMDPEELLTTKFDAAGSPVPSSSCQ